MDIITSAIDKARGKELNKKLEKILALDKTYSNMSDEELKQKSAQLIQRAQNGESESKLMTEAFALVREATWRTLGMKQYPVQIKGGISIAEGNLAEMATGEGKTIVVPFAAYLHALKGENVHVVTSNEYLAKRDCEQMSKLFEFLGMSVGLSTSAMSTDQKQSAYSCNVTYTTATELGFDYLRDNSTTSEDKKVLKGLNSIVIDEADHALLDDASTPLILAAPEKIDKQESGLMYIVAQKINSLEEGFDYEVERDKFFVSFSEIGISKLEKFFHVENLFAESNQELLNYCNRALQAKELFSKDINYVVKNGKIELVGETIGRILDGRQYSHGIQQAIEAKEGVAISPRSRTLSNVNFQNFFKLYENLGGLSGTCKTDEEEFQKIYGLCVDKIETNKPVKRTDEDFRFYHTLEAKNEAMKKRILELHKTGRPILLGTTSVENSIKLAKMLDDMGLEFNLLNAINEEEESKIIAQAGRLGAITIATNMAGRGTDIKLGGNPATKEEKQRVEALGGLAVIGTSLNSSRRVDNQLRGRAGRQGEAGSSEIYVAWDDVKETFNIGEESEDAYLDLLQKRIKKKDVDPTKEITDKKILEVIKGIQLNAESEMKASREINYALNTPENLQRVAIDSEKEDLIQIFDEFDPFDVKTGEPSTKLEQFLLSIYQDDISKIVDEWMIGKKHDNDFSPTQSMTDEDFKIAGDYLRNRLDKYGFDTKIVTDEYLQLHSAQELKTTLSNLVLSIFQRAIIETRDLLPEVVSIIRENVFQNYDDAWSSHLEHLENAKFQLQLNQTAQNANALNYFVKDTFNFYQLMKDKVRTQVIASTTKTLTNGVQAVRNYRQEVENEQSKNDKKDSVKKDFGPEQK